MAFEISGLQQELVHIGTDNNKDVLIIADCADNLFINKHFDKCEMVENWWHDIYNRWLQQQQQQQGKEQNHFTVICPYSALLLRKSPFDQHKHQITYNHNIAIDTTGSIITGYTKTKEERIAGPKSAVSHIQLSKKVLIAEPDPDQTADTTKIKNSKARSDIIILDTHLKDIPCIQVAKEIIDRKPDQQIVFTTTLLPDSLIQDISSIGLDNIRETILTKPFSLSTLMSRIDNSIEGN
jgi:CheY-like chemotaxis protein